jgi:recombination protein RecT
VAEAQFLPSYRGMIQLARRSGDVAIVYACEVCAGDKFEAINGTDRRLVHQPDWFGERGQTIGYYAVFTTRDGAADFEIMSVSDVQKIRNTSKAKDSTFWTDWFDEMAKKTVIKRLSKRMPMSVELASAIAIDNAAAMGDATGANRMEDEGPASVGRAWVPSGKRPVPAACGTSAPARW